MGITRRRVLDTVTVSLLMKGHAPAVEHLAQCARSEVFIPQPAVAEIAYGIERLPASRQKDRLAARFDLVLRDIARSVWNDEVSRRFGEVKSVLERRGVRLEDFDIAIAAHALAHGAALVTSNVRHLARVPGLELEDWS